MFHLQIHIVHLKEKYHSLSEALKDRAGLAVLGFFFQVNTFFNMQQNCF